MKILNLSRSISITALLFTSVLMTGCFSSGSSNNTSVKTTTSTSKEMAMQNSDSEPAEINDVVALKADINAVFGNPDDDPVDIKADASINDIYSQTGY